MRERLSPEQICGELIRRNPNNRLHHETIYRYIYRQPKVDVGQKTACQPLTQYLRIRHRKHYKQRGKPHKRQLIPNRVSIEQRPAVVETNTELGHWEADTVIGKGHDGVLLTLVERGTKYVLIVKLPSKHARAVSRAASRVRRKSGLPVKTITFDKGLEFVHHSTSLASWEHVLSSLIPTEVGNEG